MFLGLARNHDRIVAKDEATCDLPANIEFFRHAPVSRMC